MAVMSLFSVSFNHYEMINYYDTYMMFYKVMVNKWPAEPDAIKSNKKYR